MRIRLKVVPFLFNLLFFLIPLIFFPKSSELFEFNKLVTVYIFAILITSFWIYQMIIAKRIIFKRSILDIPILLFLSSQVLSAMFSIDIRTSIFGYYSRFNGGLLSLFSYSLLYWAYATFMNKAKTLKLLKTILVSSVIAAIYASLEHFGISPSCLIIKKQIGVDCWVQDVQSRIFGTFGQPNWLAAWLVAVIPISTYFSLKTKLFSKNYFLYTAISILFFATLLFTKSRSGLIAFGISQAVFWTILLITEKRKYLKCFALYTTIIAFLFLSIWVAGGSRSNEESESLPPNINITESGDIRKIVWKGTVNVWKANPTIGTGVETFAMSYYSKRPVEHNTMSEWNFIYNKAHNEYLNFAATTGILGLGSYILLILTSIYIFVKSHKNKIGIALIASYVSILITNFFGFSVVAISLLFFLMPAMAVAIRTKPEVLNTRKFQNTNVQKTFVFGLLLATFYLLLSFGRYWYADYLFAKGDTKNIRAAIALSPNEAVYHNKLAALELSEEEIKSTLALSPNNVKLLKSSANIYLDLAKKDPKYVINALNIYDKLEVLAPTDASVFMMKGYAFVLLNDLDSARSLLEKAVNVKPNYDQARKLLAGIYKNNGEYIKARSELEYIINNISSNDILIKEEIDKLNDIIGAE